MRHPDMPKAAFADMWANDIRKLIDASANKVQSGSDQVHAAGKTMDDIVSQVRNVTGLIAQISLSTSEQAAGAYRMRSRSCINPVERQKAHHALLVLL